jgi:hypothetical protein
MQVVPLSQRPTTTVAKILVVVIAIIGTSTFTTTTTTTLAFTIPTLTSTTTATSRQRYSMKLYDNNQPATTSAAAEDRDQEIERLQQMAAKLRAEAAALEAEQRFTMAQAVENAFDKFDTNNDGQISVQELKVGLEKAFKTELPQKRVEQLMQAFDASGDGALQLNEMVTVDQFRNKLDALVREEKEVARIEAQRAKQEEQTLQLMKAGLELINDREPTIQDKVVSIIPYLFPLLDGLQFAGPLILQHPENPFAQIAAIVYALYRSIPFGGFIAFFALNFLSGNPTINRLIRYNMQQAIFLDIALFIPALLGTVLAFVGSTAGVGLPSSVVTLGSEVLFGTMVLCITYASISSLLGITPNKIPIISETVDRRIPTFDIMNTQGRVLTREEREEVRKQLETKNKPKDDNTTNDDNDKDKN